MTTPVLETERLILRPITLDDAPAKQKHFNNWNIIRFIGAVVPWPYPDDGAETFIRDYCLPKMKDEEHFYFWGLTLKGSDEVIGCLEYRFLEDKNDNRGYWLAEHLWGQGLMIEAITAAQDFIFFKQGYPTVIDVNAVSNKASRRVKEKQGAVFIGTCEGNYHDENEMEEIWEITRENWAAFRGCSLQDLPQTPDTLPANHRPQEKKTATP